MKTRSNVVGGSQLMREMRRKTGSAGTSAAAGLAVAAMALTAMAGGARVSTEHVQKTTDRLGRPALILIHDHHVPPHQVPLDNAPSSPVKRAPAGTAETHAHR